MGTARCASCNHDLALFRPLSTPPIALPLAEPPIELTAKIDPKKTESKLEARDKPAPKVERPEKPESKPLPQQPSKSATLSPSAKVVRPDSTGSQPASPATSPSASSASKSAMQSRPAAPVPPSAAILLTKRADPARPAPEPGPMSERRLRPQAPDVMPMPGTSPDSSDAPRVEVVRHGESWGHDTTGKIPLKPMAAKAGSKGSPKAVSKEELMEQARNYVCRSCQTPIPSGHKFCGRCGAAVPPDILTLREEFYGSLQVPGRAKLILIRAEGDAAMEGLSFALNAQEHIVGRQGHLTFPEDRFVSPKHANLFYRDGKLVVRDEGSLNGVFVRVRGAVDVQSGDLFLAGEQVFRVDATPKATDHPDPDGTYFWSSPKRPSPFRVTQILQGGAPGNVCCAREAA